MYTFYLKKVNDYVKDKYDYRKSAARRCCLSLSISLKVCIPIKSCRCNYFIGKLNDKILKSGGEISRVRRHADLKKLYEFFFVSI